MSYSIINSNRQPVFTNNSLYTVVEEFVASGYVDSNWGLTIPMFTIINNTTNKFVNGLTMYTKFTGETVDFSSGITQQQVKNYPYILK